VYRIYIAALDVRVNVVPTAVHRDVTLRTSRAFRTIYRFKE